MPLSWIHPGSRYRNGSPPGDHRKPVSKAFEEYWLRIYCPIMFAALFGAEGYRRGAHACVRACVRTSVCRPMGPFEASARWGGLTR
jgi:hypothetical protein